jgi:phospholipid/cholesterol/gamma-HCH transport system ATP-binding protein
VIRVAHISKAFGLTQVLSDIHFDIADGERLCIVGGSGSGKSVLLKILLGLEQPDTGEVYIDGRLTTGLRRQEWHSILQTFGVVFQSSALFDSLDILQNVGMRLFEEGKTPRGKIEAAVSIALEKVGLNTRILPLFPAELSGGMRKRVAIARAIIDNPRYLVYDEPTTGLDPVSSQIIDDLMHELGQEPGRTSIIVTHDMSTVKSIASQVIMIHDLSIGFNGSAEAFFASDQEEVRQFRARGN